nr:MAG TPA: hypothetical protein [Caudoviricetes sp.]
MTLNDAEILSVVNNLAHLTVHIISGYDFTHTIK